MNTEPPETLADLADQFEELKDDIAFIRALRKLVVSTIKGDVPLQYEPGATNASIDLRKLTPTAVPSSDVIPSVSGKAGDLLFTDGSSLTWV